MRMTRTRVTPRSGARFHLPRPRARRGVRRLDDFELEPEVRDWLDSLSDSDFKRVDEVCGMLAEKGASSQGVRGLRGWPGLGERFLAGL